MIRRTVMALGLGLALMGGTATGIHASSHSHVNDGAALTHDRATQSGESADQANDPDPTAVCAVDAAGNQTGDCVDSQNTTGPEDAISASEAAVAAHDGDTVQSGDQSGPQAGNQSGQ